MKNDDEFPHLLARIVARPEFPLQWIHAELGTVYFAPLAQSILNSEEIHARSRIAWEFKSIAEFGEEEFICEGSASWLWADKHWQKGAIAEFSNAVCRNLWFHDEGLLFYVQDGDGGFRLASEFDASYAFVLRLIEDDAVGDLRFTAPPRWAKKLFLFRANYDAYRAFWHEGSDLTDPLHDTLWHITRTLSRQSRLIETFKVLLRQLEDRAPAHLDITPYRNVVSAQLTHIEMTYFFFIALGFSAE